MGFGILFCGYLIAYLLSLNPYAALTRFVGYIVLFVALNKLGRHNRFFGYSRLIAIPLALMAGVDAVASILSRLMGEGAPASLDKLSRALAGGLTMFDLALGICLFMAIYWLATDTALPKLARSARIAMLLSGAYGVLTGLSVLPVKLGPSYANTLALLVLCMRLIWTVVGLVLIFRCYMWICLEGDEEMAQKPSRFAFVNEYRARQAEKQERAKEETLAYAEEKRKRRAAALGPAATKAKYHKKKKKK